MCGNNVTTFISEIECSGRCHGQFTVAFSTGSVTNLLPFLWSSISYSWIFFSHWENRHNFNQISLTIFVCREVIVCWLAFHERGSSVQIVARFYLTAKEKILFMPNRCACNSFIRPENNTSKLLNKIVCEILQLLFFKSEKNGDYIFGCRNWYSSIIIQLFQTM